MKTFRELVLLAVQDVTSEYPEQRVSISSQAYFEAASPAEKAASQ